MKAAPSKTLSLTFYAKLSISSESDIGSLKLIKIPKHIEKSLSNSSVFFDSIIATHKNSKLLRGSPYPESLKCLKEPAKIKSHTGKQVSILYSLESMHLSHLVRCNSGITSFFAKCL